ncbi:GNAT family N-acetyltransferase [Wukongibacter baidiensis]|uniref:GNAT family N-acetyltransferase n=1 Tax=Wukongibacter baidiensis TaxID=1723361 RepID=UPI003D7F91DE
MKFQIREATKNDYESVNELVVEVHNLHVESRPNNFKENDRPLNRRYYEELLDDIRCKIFLVETQGKEIIAYTILRVIEIESNSIVIQRKFVYMEELCAKEQYRGKGIGELLFNKAVEYTKRIGVSSLELSVWEFNDPAIKFYESMGMKTRTRRMEIEV